MSTAVECERNFPLRATGFIHTPSVHYANVCSVMPANRLPFVGLRAVFHTVADAPAAEFTARLMVPAGQAEAPLTPRQFAAEGQAG